LFPFQIILFNIIEELKMNQNSTKLDVIVANTVIPNTLSK